jgi:excinuclease UvrABC nuclease subunit
VYISTSMPTRRSRTPDRPRQLRAPVAAVDIQHATYSAAPIKVRRLLREHVREGAEDRPGIYRVLGATGIVLYVGKSSRVRSRLLSYFRAKGRRDKQATILRHAHSIDWEYAPCEFAALLRELRLIKQYRPRYNRAMNVDESPRGYVALTRGPVPGLRIVQRSDDPDAELLYGPFRRLSMLADAVRALAECTGLRDCQAPPATLGFTRTTTRSAGCLRHELGSCPGPCVGRGTADDYAARVGMARAFLAGEDDAPLGLVRQAMLDASDAWQFERAGTLKTRLAALEWLAERLSRFHANVDRLSFTYRAATHDGGEHVYLVRRGTVRAELPAPRTPEEHAELARLTERVFAGPGSTGRDIPTHDLDEFYLVSSWFRRRPQELERVQR